jgi:vacuolar-type H+-ATPase subunit D/Vma8
MTETKDPTLERLAAAGRTVARRRTQQTAAAIAEERVRSLESEIADLKSRVNGLLFVLVGAVATQVILRLFG